MRRLVVGAALVVGLGAIAGTATCGALHSPGAAGGGPGWYAYGTGYAFAPDPGRSCSAASRWCVTSTRLSSGRAIWEVTCGPAPGPGADLSGASCPAVDVSLEGPPPPVKAVGSVAATIPLPAVTRGWRVLPVGAASGSGADNCFPGWCIAGGEVVHVNAVAGPGITGAGTAAWSGYVPPQTYCESSCSPGWHLDLQGVAHGQHWTLRVDLPRSGAAG